MSCFHARQLTEEYPWIPSIVGNRSFQNAKVQRLDEDCLASYGRSGCDGTSYDRWYLVNKDGLLLNEVGVWKPTTFLQRLFPSLCNLHYETVMDGIARTLNEFPQEEITYVLNACGTFHLYFYKIPKGHTMVTFLDAFREKITADLNKEE